MATRVDPQDSVALGEPRRHVLPHPPVAADGVRQDDGLAGTAGILDVQRGGSHRFPAFFAFPRDSITARASLNAWFAAGMPQ